MGDSLAAALPLAATTPFGRERRRFDDVVIGASPMLLLQAMKMASEGRDVCVLDQHADMGGVWRSVRVAGEMKVEIACHLIEDFPMVYEYLEEASGIPFVALEEQPIRVTRSGRIVRYSSRKTLALSVLWAGLLLAGYRLRWLIFGPDPVRFEKAVMLKRKLADFRQYLWPILWRGSVVKAPQHGFAEFVSALEQGCRKQGVVLETFDVKHIKRHEKGWRLLEAGGKEIRATRLHCTASAGFRKTDAGAYEAIRSVEACSWCCLVEVPHEKIKRRVSYAAFWNHPRVVRIARIDQPEPRQTGLLYLVQFRGDGKPSAESMAQVIRHSLEEAQLVENGAGIKQVGEIECRYTPHRGQLPEGLIDTDFYGYSSAGNLASGLARWLEQGVLESSKGALSR